MNLTMHVSFYVVVMSNLVFNSTTAVQSWNIINTCICTGEIIYQKICLLTEHAPERSRSWRGSRYFPRRRRPSVLQWADRRVGGSGSYCQWLVCSTGRPWRLLRSSVQRIPLRWSRARWSCGLIVPLKLWGLWFETCWGALFQTSFWVGGECCRWCHDGGIYHVS